MDMHNGQILALLQAHEASISSMLFDDYSHQLFTGSINGDLKIWDALSLQLREQFPTIETPQKLSDIRGKRAVRLFNS